MAFTIKVPGSAANLGPGFDTLASSVSLYLVLNVTLKDHNEIALKYVRGRYNIEYPLENNMIITVARNLLEKHGISLPGMEIEIENGIPIGRGLGSSAAAAVAGLFLANHVGKLNYSKDQLASMAADIDETPDNPYTSVFGGTLACMPGFWTHINVASEIRAVAIIPDYQLSTKKARGVLPETYSKQDVVFNLQRLAVFIAALGNPSVDAKMLHAACTDRVHQPHRSHLVAGMDEMLQAITPQNIEGVVACFLSGAGPTVLVLATGNFSAICDVAQKILDSKQISFSTEIVDIGVSGTSVQC